MMTYESRKGRPWDPIVSFAPLLVYSFSLPYLLLMSPLMGFDVFMTYAIKSLDHWGKIFAVLGYNPVKERYIT